MAAAKSKLPSTSGLALGATGHSSAYRVGTTVLIESHTENVTIDSVLSNWNWCISRFLAVLKFSFSPSQLTKESLSLEACGIRLTWLPNHVYSQADATGLKRQALFRELRRRERELQDCQEKYTS